MLQLYDRNHNKIQGLTKYRNLCIESVLSTADETLSFYIPRYYSYNIENEGYIRTKVQEYVIKIINPSNDDYVSVIATLNVEDLEGKEWDRFNSSEATISECLSLAFAGTGWTVDSCEVTKERSISLTNTNSWKILQECRKVYLCEFELNTLNKKVKIYTKRGSDKGAYFKENLNLVELNVSKNSNTFYTRLVAKGKQTSETTGEGDSAVTTDTTITCTVTNNTYSNKVKTFYWQDERYTILEHLQEDAQAKLDAMAVPKISYSVKVDDLAKHNNQYSNILSYGLGDTVTIISLKNKTKIKQRIVKMKCYPEERNKNTCEISNAIYTFEDARKSLLENTETLNNITSDNGTISKNALSNLLDTIILDELDVASLHALEARIGFIEADYIKTNDLEADRATIEEAVINSLTAGEVFASHGEFATLEANVGVITTLLGGTVTTGSTQTIVLNAQNTTIETALIKDAMIQSVSADKITSGTINTNLVNITSDDGKILITDNTMQFKDSNNYTRIQLGEDSNGDFNFIVRAEDGTTTLIDGYGIKEKAIADKLIKTKMVDDKAITGDKIDYESFVSKFNSSTNTNTINSSKIMVDGTSQSLYVAFNTLQTNFKNIDTSGINLCRGIEYWKTRNSNHITVNSNINGWIQIKRIGNTGYHAYVPFSKILESGVHTVKLKIKSSAAREVYLGTYNTEDFLSTGNVFNMNFSQAGKWYEFEFTFDNTTDNTNGLFISTSSMDENQILDLYWVKVSKGINIGDWTACQLDIDNILSTHTTSISTMQGQINTLISQTSQITNNTNDITTLTTNYSSLNQTVNSLNTTVSSHTSSISSLNTTVSSHTSSISQLQSSIALKVESSDITAAINGLQIGGANIVINGNFKKDATNWYVNRDSSSDAWCGKVLDETDTLHPNRLHTTINSISSGGWAWFNLYQTNYNFVAEKTYTLSFLAHSGTLKKVTARICKNDGTNVQMGSVDFAIGTTWTKCVYTFKAKYNASIGDTRLQFTHGVGTVKFTNIKLEEGSKATSFTVAQEDIESDIKSVSSAVSELTVTTSGISSRVTNVETLTSSNTASISNLTTKVSTVEQNITADAIVTKVQTSLAGGTNSINTTYFKMDNIYGLTIKNGGFRILDDSNTAMMSVSKAGSINIRGNFYNYDTSGNLRCSMTDYKCNYYDESGNYLGGIGTNKYVLDENIKGLTIDLDTGGKFISFSVKKDSLSNVYTSVLSYHRSGSFDTEGLNAGCNLDMHNYTINNVSLKNVGAGGFNATNGDYQYVTEIHGNADGSIGWTTRTLKIREGIIVAA